VLEHQEQQQHPRGITAATAVVAQENIARICTVNGDYQMVRMYYILDISDDMHSE
jgi:hypothetical protein